MYCSNCGIRNENSNKFCFSCGNKLILKNEKKNGNKETSLILGIVCLISSFILNILCFIPGIISIIYAKRYKRESGKLGVGFGLSLGGMLFSFIVFLIIAVGMIFFINVVNNSTYYEDYYNMQNGYVEELSNV